MLLFTEEQVRQALPMSAAIQCMRGVFSALATREAANQTRRRLKVPGGSVLHSLAGYCGRYFGTKVYATHPRHGAWFTFLLFDSETAQPLAQFEANHLGQIRTGAVSGLAADLLCSPERQEVALIGAGFQARSQFEAISLVRRIASVRIWSRSEEKRAALAKELATRFPATAVNTTEEATENATLILTATSAKTPVVADSAVRADAIVLAMGSNNPGNAELPPELVNRSSIVVDDLDAARTEAGDLLLADVDWDHVVPLQALIADSHQQRDQSRPVIFKSVGLGVEDVAAAAFVYEQAILAAEAGRRNPATH